MQVSAELDLVDVAYALEQDEVERVEQWTRRNQMGPVTDDQARAWVDSEALLWSVVVKPWVLVQQA